MNKKIKVIDLFNIIANEEEFPQTIIYQGIIYKYTKNEYGEGYLDIGEDNSYNWLADEIWCYDKEVLNDEVEILEDNTEEIEELDLIKKENIWDKLFMCEDKINELVKAVNELRKDLKDE